MLCIQTDLYVTACQIVCSVSLVSFFAVNRLSCYSSTTFQVFQKLSSGELSLKLSITLSGQTAVYTMNFGDLTQTVEKI